MKLLLDTCCILWAVAESERLSEEAKRIIVHPDAEVHVSAISCAEIACASDRGQIELDRHWKKWFRYFTELNAWQVIPIDLEIIEEAYSLPEKFHQDPVDKIIVATARKLQCQIVTADRKILDYPHVQSVW